MLSLEYQEKYLWWYFLYGDLYFMPLLICYVSAACSLKYSKLGESHKFDFGDLI